MLVFLFNCCIFFHLRWFIIYSRVHKYFKRFSIREIIKEWMTLFGGRQFCCCDDFILGFQDLDRWSEEGGWSLCKWICACWMTMHQCVVAGHPFVTQSQKLRFNNSIENYAILADVCWLQIVVVWRISSVATQISNSVYLMRWDCFSSYCRCHRFHSCRHHRHCWC